MLLQRDDELKSSGGNVAGSSRLSQFDALDLEELTVN